jgi:hypothetical protein
LKDQPTFQPSYPVEYSYHGVRRHVKFSFGLGGSPGTAAVGLPAALFQTARLTDLKDVNSALFLMEGVTMQEPTPIIPKDRCIAVVYSDIATDDAQARESIESFWKVGTVIDVSNMVDAVQKVQGMGLPLNGHVSSNGNGNGHPQ